MRRIASVLTGNGSLVFSVEHPLRYANSTNQWVKLSHTDLPAWPIDSYLATGRREERHGTLAWTKWHVRRPIM